MKKKYLHHGVLIGTGLTCKKIPCCVCMKRITLCNCLCCFFFLFFCQPYPEYRGIRGEQLFLQTIKHLLQYTVLEIQLRSLKYMVVTRIRKNLENLSIPFVPKRYKAIVCWCKQTTSNSFQMCLYRIYLLKLYDKSIITLLTNKQNSIDFMKSLYLQY